MTRAGFRVAPGIIVTTGLYRAVMHGTGLSEAVEHALADLDGVDQIELNRRCERIREHLVSFEIPTEDADRIRDAYASLGTDVRVAVRSSGTLEDSQDASFAGMHDTYLDILRADAVIDAVKRCWASLWTARAVTYRQKRGSAHDQVAMAVVVQTMVASEKSGVCSPGTR